MTIHENIAELRQHVLQHNSPDAAEIKRLEQALAEGGDEAVKALGSLLDDAELSVSEAAADVLELIATEAAHDALVAYSLRHLNDPTGLTKLTGPGWKRLRHLGKQILPAMARSYDSRLPFETRLTMIFIAQQIGDPATSPLLEAALMESDTQLGEAAAEALGRVGGPGAYERLIRLLRSADMRLRLGAVRGLGRLKDRAAVVPLLAVLTSSDQSIPASDAAAGEDANSLRQAAAQVINQLTGERLNGDVESIRAWLRVHLEERGE